MKASGDRLWQRRSCRARLAVTCLLALLTASPCLAELPANGSAVPLPPSTNEVRLEKNLFVPMRDGVKLATDLYFPKVADARLPVILIRTPYSKKSWRKGGGRVAALSELFAGHGYIVAVQDKRGRFQSQGVYTPATHEDVDGYDTIDWLSKQPWSNGKVGTYGCSDAGDAQVWAAQARHPAMAAMIPQASGSSVGAAGNRYRYFGAYNGGTFQLGPGASWMLKHGSKIYWQPPAWLDETTAREIADDFDPGPADKSKDANLTALLWTLPTIDLMKRAGRSYTDWEAMLQHEPGDAWWQQFPYFKGNEKVDVPALFINSWQDFGVNETLYLFNFFREHGVSQRARENQFVIISPTTHCDSELMEAPTMVGERELGDARKDYWSIYLDWYAYWLKGEKNAITRMPHVQYYLMGKNEWRAASAWPLPNTDFQKFYLRSGGRANSVQGDGALSRDAPRDEKADVFVYDPMVPVQSGSGPYDLGEGFFDQRNIETRNDVLVYTSPPLTQGVEVTGPITAKLFVSSSAKDTDFAVKLVDVYPDGRAFFLQEGILRARYREGLDHKVWMTSGEIYQVNVALDATSNYFPAGHRIRVEVTSSNFPRFDRNLNTGGRNYDEKEGVIAHNTIHHAANAASYVLLPVIPN